MNELKIFNNPDFGEIRALTIEGEPWFVGRDVCVTFGDTTPSRSLGRVDEQDKMRYVIQTAGGNQEATLINESGLYSLLFSMQPEKANKGGAHTVPPSVQERIDKLHAFKRWVTSEVLPSIRKHGAYMTPQTLDRIISDPDFGIRLLTELKSEREQKAALQAANAQLTESNAALTAEIKAFEPVRKYVDEILSSTGTLTTTQIAADYSLSAFKLNKILHEEKIQHKVNGQWILYRAQMEKGYTKSITIPITRANGEPDTKMHTQWTQKGRLMIHEILTRRGVRANIDMEG